MTDSYIPFFANLNFATISKMFSSNNLNNSFYVYDKHEVYLENWCKGFWSSIEKNVTKSQCDEKEGIKIAKKKQRNRNKLKVFIKFVCKIIGDRGLIQKVCV